MSDTEMNDTSTEQDGEVAPLESIQKILEFPPDSPTQQNDKNASLFPAQSGPERMPVYLRIRPFSTEELNRKEDQSCMTLEDDKTLVASAPQSSHTFKTSQHGQGKTKHHFSFTRIFGEDTTQKHFFDDTILTTVHDFIKGQNGLVFTYGVTNSGKTYTIQGSVKEAGILPRALDVLFTIASGKQMETTSLRPNMFCDVIKLTAAEREAHTKLRETLLKLTDHNEEPDMSCLLGPEASILESSSMSEDSLMQRESIASSTASITMDSLDVTMDSSRIQPALLDICSHGDIKVIIFVSFAEVYNEQVYDLLDPLPRRKNARRPTLTMREDKHGSPYIKGLREVHVTSADEAYRLLALGRSNLQMACTRLNSNSSRSHCIFTIKMLRVVNVANPNMARVSMLSFCDLAGSERHTKTHSLGDRIKEAGNINSSLLTLGRCITALRHNQQHKDHQQVVPFRESKLTRLFQSFFSGKGRAMMIVNVNQLASAFDETLHALKYSAVAKQVIIEEPPPPTRPPLVHHRSQISMLLAQPSSDNRATMAWASPNTYGKIFEEEEQERIADVPLPEDDDDDDIDSETEDSDNERVKELEESVGLLRRALIQARQENAQMEMRIRNEVCDEMAKQLVEIERGYSERFHRQRQEAEERSEKKMALLAHSIKVNNRFKRRRPIDEDSSDEEIVQPILNSPDKCLSASVPSGDAQEAVVLKQRCGEMEREMAELRDTMSTEAAELKQQLYKLQEKLHEFTAMEQQVEEMRQQVDEAAAEKEQLRLQQSDKQSPADLHKGDREHESSLDADELVTRLTDAESELESQQEQVTKLQQLVDLLQCQLSDKDSVISDLQATSSHHQHETEKLEAMMKDKVHENAGLLAEVASLKRDTSDTRMETSQCCQDTAQQQLEYYSSLAKLQQTIAQLEDNVREQNNKLTDNEFQIDELNSKLLESESDKTSQDAVLSGVKVSMQELEGTLTSRNREAQELQLEYCQVKQDLAHSQKQLEDYILRVNEQAEVIGQLKDRNKESKEAAKAKRECQKQKGERQKQEGECQKQEVQTSSQLPEANHLATDSVDEQSPDAVDTQCAADQGNEKLSAEISELKKHLEEQAEKMALFEKEISDLQSEKKHLQAQLMVASDNQVDDLEELKEQLEVLQAEARAQEAALVLENEEEVKSLKQSWEDEIVSIRQEYEDRLAEESKQFASQIERLEQTHREHSVSTGCSGVDQSQVDRTMEELKAECDSYKSETTKQQTEIQMKAYELEEALKNINKLESELMRREEELKEFHTKHQGALDELGGQLEAMKAESQVQKEALRQRDMENEEEVRAMKEAREEGLLDLQRGYEKKLQQREAELGEELTRREVKLGEELTKREAELMDELKRREAEHTATLTEHQARVMQVEQDFAEAVDKLAVAETAALTQEKAVKQAASESFTKLSAEHERLKQTHDREMAEMKQDMVRLTQQPCDQCCHLQEKVATLEGRLDGAQATADKLKADNQTMVTEMDNVTGLKRLEAEKVSKLQEELALKMMSSKKLELECEKLETQMEQSRACLARSMEATTKLEADNQRMRDKLTSFSDDKSLVGELKDKLTAMEQNHAAETAKLELQVQEVETDKTRTLSQLEHEKREGEEQVKELKATLCEVEAGVSQAEKRLKEVMEKGDMQEKELSELRQAASQSETTIQTLKDQVHSLEVEKTKTSETLMAEVKVKDSYQREVNILKEEISLLNDQVSQKELKERTLQQDLTNAAHRIRDQDDRYVALEEELKQAQEAALQDVDSSKVELEAVKAQLKKRDTLAQEELSLAQQELKQLAHKLDSLCKRLLTQQKSTSELEDKLESERQKFKQTLEAITAEKKSQETILAGLKVAVAEQEDTMVSQDQILQRRDMEAEDMRKEWMELEERNKGCLRELEKVRDDKKKLQTESEARLHEEQRTRNTLHNTEQQLEQSRRQLEDTCRDAAKAASERLDELHQYKEKVRSLEEERDRLVIQTQESKNEADKSRIQALKTKYKGLEDENTRLLKQVEQIENHKSNELEKWRQERDKLVEGLESVLKQKDNHIHGLEKQNQELLCQHKQDLNTVVRAKDQIISDMRGQNQILQGHIPCPLDNIPSSASSSLQNPVNTIKEEPEQEEKENSKKGRKSRAGRRTTQSRKRASSANAVTPSKEEIVAKFVSPGPTNPSRALAEAGQEHPVKAPPRRRRKLCNPDITQMLDVPADETMPSPPEQPSSPHVIVGRKLRSRKR